MKETIKTKKVHESSVWHNAEHGLKYRIDGDEVIIKFPSGKLITFLPASNESLVESKISLDYYDKFIDKSSGTTPGRKYIPVKDHPILAVSNSDSREDTESENGTNNTSLEAKGSAQKLADYAGVTVAEFINARNLAVRLFLNKQIN